ncbi:MAG: trigger factor family protein, partial [Muribaculaceae bacterium]|nr:trigger factor family protein [Muribaculaceae bacterium]
MNVTLEKTSDNTAIINVAIQEADYQEKVTNELKTFGRTHTIPGCRKGHVSIDQLRRRFGRQMKSDVINREAADAAIKYLQDNKINVLGQPIPVEVKEINLEDKDYTFQYEIGLAPEINIDLSNDITVPYYTITVSKEMVEEQDRGLRERFGAQVPGEEVDKKALVKGALMELNPDGTIKEGADAIQVIDGIVAPMFFKDKEQADLFLGKKVGDKVVFNPWKTCEGNEAEMASMLHLDKKVAADVKADFEMAISEIIVVKLAELGEEYYKDVFGPDKVHNEEEYYKALREMIAASLEPNSEIMFRNDAQSAIMAKYGDSIQLPAEFLKKWLLVRNPELTKEDLDKDFDGMIPGIKWQLIRDV